MRLRFDHAQAAAIAPLLAAALLAGCSGDAQSARGRQGPPPPIVEVATVERTSIDEGLSLVGQLEPWESVMLRPETEGVIETVDFREGQDVARGDVLFTLRDDWQRARLREAEADVLLAERAYERAKQLAGERIMAASELDQATANRNAAHARVDLARVELERMTIRAPFDGVVGQRLVSPGDRVDHETNLLQIDAVANLRVAFALPEPIVDLVRTGMTFDVAVAAYPDETFPGSVYFVAPSLDVQSRHLLLKGEVDNTDRRLRPGMFARLRLEMVSHPEVLAAPESAIVADPAGAYVYRVGTDGVAERVSIELGLRRGGKVEIKRGLEPGDVVVSAGTNKVVPGSPVQVAGAEPGGGPEGPGGGGGSGASPDKAAAGAAAEGRRGS